MFKESIMRYGIIAIVLTLLTSPAQAHEHRRHHHIFHISAFARGLGFGLKHMLDSMQPHPPGCPHRQFCGCGTSVRVFGHPVRNLYLAANWFRFPRTYPHTGAVAVRQHHVFYIERYDGDGLALAYDPNSGGHMTRLHEVRLIGYTIVQP
jgi:hypothetical protein